MTLPKKDKSRSSGLPFPVILFDWGDTIMKDDPTMSQPMALWPRVEAIADAQETLQLLHVDRTIGLATGAEISTESDIRTALRRVNLDDYFDHIFCYTNTGFHKPSLEFYRFILESLRARADEVLMVGDAFEKDVQAANRAGIRAVWFNPLTTEEKTANMYRTIHNLTEIETLLNLDW